MKNKQHNQPKRNQNHLRGLQQCRPGLTSFSKGLLILLSISGLIVQISCKRIPLPPDHLSESARKSLSFRLSSIEGDGRLRNREALGTAWTVEPVLRKDTYDIPKPSFLAIYKSGVYIKKFSKGWRWIPKQTPEETLEPLIEAKTSRISAFQMEGGGDLLTIAYKNLTVQVVDIKKSTPKELVVIAEFNFDPKDEYVEGLIEAIGHIPYTNQIILAPTASKLVMLNRAWGEVILEKRSPLDKIKFIVAPAQTTIPKFDPYHEKYKGYQEYGDKLNFLIKKPTVVALTSVDTEYTALVDYTSLKTINYFTVRKNHERYDNPAEYVVTSICFYGGVPAAHTYALMTRHTNKQVVLFDGIFNLYKGVVDLKTDYQNTELTWMNATTYILACQYNDKDSRCHPTLVDFSPLRGSEYTLNFTKEDFTLPIKSSFQMIAYKAFHLKHPHINMHYNIDFLYLTMYLDNGRLHIKPPFFGWNFCIDSSLDGLNDTTRMLLGLRRYCKDPMKFMGGHDKSIYCANTPRCILFHHKSQSEKRFKTIGFRGNLFRRQCHMGSYNALHYDKRVNKFRCSGGFFSSTRASLYAIQYTANPIDPHNLMKCIQTNLTGFEQLFGDRGDKKYKKCILSDFTNKIDDRTINNPKGWLYTDSDRKKGFNDLTYMFNDRNLEKNYFVSDDQRYFVIRRKGPMRVRSYKSCYYIVPDKTDRKKYKVKVKHPYKLEYIEKDRSWKAESQVNLYDSSGDFNQYFCKKNCPEGFFYDFHTIDCRACPPGCGSCNDEGKCKKPTCATGTAPYIKPKHHLHAADYKKWISNGRKCMTGCQRGFYYDFHLSKCVECEGNCLACEPNPKYSPFDKNEIKPSLCLKCQVPEEREKGLMVDSRTGQCVDQCEGKGATLMTLDRHNGESDVITCSVCDVYGCEQCDFVNSKKCLKCQRGSQLVGDSACKELPSTLTQFEIFLEQNLLRLLSILCLIILVVLLGLVIKKKWSESAPIPENVFQMTPQTTEGISFNNQFS